MVTPITLDDTAPCHGATTTHDGINQAPVDYCYACERRGRLNGAVPIAPAAVCAPDGQWHCPNRRSSGRVITHEQADDVDETAGLLHGRGKIGDAAAAQQSQGLGGVDSSSAHTPVVSAVGEA